MKATIDGITYEGTEEEIRRIVENPPHRTNITIPSPYPPGPIYTNPDWPHKNWDGSPRVTCCTEKKGTEE